MNYTELHITCSNELKDILIAELDYIQADTISETENGLLASFLEDIFSEEEVKNLSTNYGFQYSFNAAEKKNWNEEWEKNYPSLIVENCSIRASFHPKPVGVDYDIVINPKMSFGTGHHETTSLMIAKLLNLDLKNQTVLDMGTGTGILAILAEMKGANHIIGIDIDDWSVENSIENVALNNCKFIKIFKGDVQKLNEFGNFELIIANINRNILLEDMEYYNNHLAKNGKILFSGFYTQDIPFIEEKAISLGLEKAELLQKNNWVLLEFIKK